MARFRGCELIGREDIPKKKVGNALGSGKKGSTENGGGGQSRQGKADLRRTRGGWAIHSLVGYIQEKIAVAKKICSKDG